jgi:hypothetical protein
MFPTPVGMDRRPLRAAHVLSHVPHACGDGPVQTWNLRVDEECSPLSLDGSPRHQKPLPKVSHIRYSPTNWVTEKCLQLT